VREGVGVKVESHYEDQGLGAGRCGDEAGGDRGREGERNAQEDEGRAREGGRGGKGRMGGNGVRRRREERSEERGGGNMEEHDGGMGGGEEEWDRGGKRTREDTGRGSEGRGWG